MYDIILYVYCYGHIVDVDMEGEHWRRCTFYTNKALGLATGAIYVNATSIDKSMSRVIIILLSSFPYTLPVY